MSFYQYTLQNSRFINLLDIVVIFFNILWFIICDIEIFFSFKWLFFMKLLVSYEFYIKKNYFLVFNSSYQFGWYKDFFFLALIKSDKQVNTTNLFNKQIVLELRNLDLFNKNIDLVSIHIVKYLKSRHDTNPTHEHVLLSLH